MTRAYVLDPTTRDVLGLVDQSWEKLKYTRRYFGMDTFEMTIQRSRLWASTIEPGRLLYLPDEGDRIFEIEQVQSVAEGSTRNDLMTVAGRSLEGIAMADRLVMPPSNGNGYDRQTAVPAETAIKHYVTDHASSTATTVARRIPSLVCIASGGTGVNVTVAGRYQTVFDIVKQIGLLAGMGWEILYNPTLDRFEFDTINGVDRSASVFFDFAFETLERWEELRSLVDSKTLAVVAGQGEAEDREVVTRYSGTEPTGFARREVFLDARDIALGATTELNARGDAYLAAAAGETRLEAGVHQYGSFRYGVHWDMGDLVLIRNEERGISYTARIVEVEKAFDVSAAAPVVTCVIDRPFPTMKEQVNGAGAAPGAIDTVPVTGAIIYPEKIQASGFGTTSTGASDTGKWTKVCDGTLSIQYADHRFTALVINEGSSTADATRGILYVAVKQQAAFGNQPSVKIEWDGDDAEADDWVVVVSSVAGPTTWALYHRIDTSYNTVIVSPILMDSSHRDGSINFYEAQGFLAALPAGTIYTGVWRSPTFGIINFGGSPGAAPDVNLYRSAANVLRTDDYLAAVEFRVGASDHRLYESGNGIGFIATGGSAVLSKHKGILVSTSYADPDPPSAGIQFGADANLYRAGANLLKTDDNFEILGALTVGATAYFGGAGAGTTANGLAISGGNIEMRNANPFIDFKIDSADFGARIIYDYNVADALEFTGASGGYIFDANVLRSGEAWINATYLNSWVDYSTGSWPSARYRKDANGYVYLSGMIKSGTIGAAAFNLPAGYRPAASPTSGLLFPVIASGNIMGRVDVRPNGDVVIIEGSTTWTSLEGIIFKAEQ